MHVHVCTRDPKMYMHVHVYVIAITCINILAKLAIMPNLRFEHNMGCTYTCLSNRYDTVKRMLTTCISKIHVSTVPYFEPKLLHLKFVLSQIHYLPNGETFTSANLKVSLQLNGETVVWTPLPALDMSLQGNLLGTVRVSEHF